MDSLITLVPRDLLWVVVAVALFFVYKMQQSKTETLEKTLDKLSDAIDKLSDTLDKQDDLVAAISARLSRVEAVSEMIREDQINSHKRDDLNA